MDDAAPGIGTIDVDVLFFGSLDRGQESLAKVGEGANGLGFDVAAGTSGEETAESGGQIAGREILAGKEISAVAAKLFGGLGLRLFPGMETAELGMAGLAGRAAAAAIGESEST